MRCEPPPSHHHVHVSFTDHSTINGYEGTGRSLSLKLIKQLRTQSNVQAQNGGAAVEGTAVSASGGARKCWPWQ